MSGAVAQLGCRTADLTGRLAVSSRRRGVPVPPARPSVIT